MDRSLFAPSLVARDGHTLRVLIVVRVHAKHRPDMSLAQRIARCKLATNGYQGAVEFDVTAIGGMCKHLDAEDQACLHDAIRGGRYDLVIAEDHHLVQILYRTCTEIGTSLWALRDGRNAWRESQIHESHSHPYRHRMSWRKRSSSFRIPAHFVI